MVDERGDVESSDRSTSSNLTDDLSEQLDADDAVAEIDSLLESETHVEEYDLDGEYSVGVVYPDIYPNGIANISHQMLYKLVNQREDWYATRTYEPGEDLKRLLEETDQPYFTWEDRKPLGEHDLLFVSLSFEELAPKLLAILDHSDVPIWAANRIDDDPLVVCGGTTPNYNPEPYAHFVDCFYIGESEVGVPTILDAFEEIDAPHTPRRDYLKRFAEEKGIYVPSFYRVDYDEDGTVVRRDAIEPEADLEIEKVNADSIIDNPAHMQIVTPHTVYDEPCFSIELGRGCTMACNFCQYGHNNRSPRWLTVEEVREIIENVALEVTTVLNLIYEASPAGYLDDLFEMLEDLNERREIDVRLGAFTANQVTEHMIEVAAKCGQESIIVAPEAASGSMRAAVGKEGFYDDEDIFRQARLCDKHGIPDFGLYLLNGIPGETMEDMRDLGDLIVETEKNVCDDGVLEAHVNPVFPKPMTPFQWAPMERPERGREKMKHLIEHLEDAGLSLKLDDVSKSVIGAQRYRAAHANQDEENDVIIRSIVGTKMHYTQPILARGDRRICDVLYDAYRDGNDVEAWEQAFERYGIDDELFFRERDAEESELPWGFIQNTLRESERRSMWNRSVEAVSSD